MPPGMAGAAPFFAVLLVFVRRLDLLEGLGGAQQRAAAASQLTDGLRYHRLRITL